MTVSVFVGSVPLGRRPFEFSVPFTGYSYFTLLLFIGSQVNVMCHVLRLVVTCGDVKSILPTISPWPR